MKSLLSKYFFLTAVLILLSLVTLGGGLSAQIYKYSIGEKHQSLEDTAVHIADMSDDFMSGYTVISEQVFRNLLNFMSNGGKMHILVCDTSGRILISSDSSGTGYAGISIDREIISKLYSNGNYSGTGTLNGLYKGSNYTVGLPIKTETGQVLGSVFVTTSMDTVTKLLFDILRMFLFSALFVFLIAAMSCFIVVRKMTRPLKMIATTARSFAMGDFNARVPVTTGDEIGELTAAFNSMADSIEKSEELRRTFVANVSHELRSPMTSIGGFVDGIIDGTIPEERQGHYLSIISSEVRRLSRLVSRMLDITRLQAADFAANSVKFDFCELIRRAIISFEARIKEKNIRLEVSLSEYSIEVIANEDAIFQVIYNLIDNAIKFSAWGETIVIIAENRSGKASFQITNHGANIPEDQLPYIFDRFHKTDSSRSNDKSGLGLGLYIAKMIISQHKGEIGVQSKDGFTEFCFTIPIEIKLKKNET